MRKSNKLKKKTINGLTFYEGTDNIFRDLGFPEDEAVNLLARSQLMMEIEKILRQKKLTQNEAAKLFGVGQPRISDLYKGKIDRFTVDMLMKWLAKLGKNVTIKVGNKKVA